MRAKNQEDLLGSTANDNLETLRRRRDIGVCPPGRIVETREFSTETFKESGNGGGLVRRLGEVSEGRSGTVLYDFCAIVITGRIRHQRN